MDSQSFLPCKICNNVAFANSELLMEHMVLDHWNIELEENLGDDLNNFILSNEENLDIDTLNFLVDDPFINNNNYSAEDSSPTVEKLDEQKEQQIEDDEDEITIVEIINRETVQQTVNDNKNENSNVADLNLVEGDLSHNINAADNNIITSKENKEKNSTQQNQPVDNIMEDEITIIKIIKRGRERTCLICNREYESEDDRKRHQKVQHFRYIFPKAEEDFPSTTPCTSERSVISFAEDEKVENSIGDSTEINLNRTKTTADTRIENDDDDVVILTDYTSDENNEIEVEKIQSGKEKTLGRPLDIDFDPNAIFSDPDGESSDDGEDNKMYECKLCGKLFFWRCRLKKHGCTAVEIDSNEKIESTENMDENVSDDQSDQIVSSSPIPEIILSPNSESGGLTFSSSNSSSSPSTSTPITPTLSKPNNIISGTKNPRKIKKNRPQDAFECIYCGKKLSAIQSLRIHERTHTGEKPFHCKFPNCSFSCNAQSNLGVHELRHGANRLPKISKSHYGPRKYKCNLCKKAFKSKENFEIHQRIHK